MKHDDALGALVLANPIVDADAYRDQMVEPNVFLTMTMERIDEMDTMHTTPETPEPTRKWKPIIVAIGAAAVVASAVLFATALQGDDADVAGSSEPTKTYDGTGCVYDGATEFDLNDEVTFTFTNESDSTAVGFVVWEVPDGTTAELIYEVGIFEATGTVEGTTALYEFFEAKFPPTQLDTEYPVTVVLDKEGLYAVNCIVDTSAPDNTHFATIITVSG
jgi:hypothetical protein